MVMQKDAEIYPGSGKRRPYIQRGGGVCIILHLSACTGVNTSVYELGWSMEVTVCERSMLWCIAWCLCSLPGFPFIVPRRSLGYKYRRVPLYRALRAVVDWFISCTPVRHGGWHVAVVALLSFDTRPFPRKETCLVEGRTPCSALLSWALTLDVSRGAWLDVLTLLPTSWHALDRLVGKATKRMTGRVPVPHHASRDWRVRWERDRCIKCPGSHARVSRRAASLRSRPPDSLEPVSVFDCSWRSRPDRFARRSFRLRCFGRWWPYAWLGGASSWGPRLAYG